MFTTLDETGSVTSMTDEKKMKHMDEVVEEVLLRKGTSLHEISLLEKKIETADRSEIGTLMKVNEYVVTAELARGSFGTVYLVEVTQPQTLSTHTKTVKDTADKEPPPPKCYAMKTFMKPKSKGLTRGPGRGGGRGGGNKRSAAEEELQVIRKEISMMKRLSHPHIVNLLEVIEETKAPHSIYMIMEFVEGGDSMTMVKNDKLESNYVPSFICSRSGTVMGEGQASKVFRQLISAMAYLHYNEIAHRDLKPENLLLTANGDLKLADFGVSEDFSAVGNDDKRDGMVANTKGSWPFFSPEMCDADEENKYDAYKADVWAAASCLWVFVFGVLPFWQPHDPHNPQPIFDKLIEAKTALPSYPSRKSPELYELFEKMFTADPIKRPSFTDCEEFNWLKNHTTKEIETALNLAANTLVLADEEVNRSTATAGDVSTISLNIKNKMLSLAQKSRREVDTREEQIITQRSRTISDKKEVRKSLTKVYAPTPIATPAAAARASISNVPSLVEEESIGKDNRRPEDDKCVDSASDDEEGGKGSNSDKCVLDGIELVEMPPPPRNCCSVS